jgi:TonB family protein
MRVTRSLGFGLDEKALEAIQHWRFNPGTFQGQPIPVVTMVPVDFRLPEKQSRWHLIRVEFTPPAGASRPQFSKTTYPYGAGISTYASEEGLVIIAIGRQATAKVAFDVDEHGSPVNFQVLSDSREVWGPEALAVVRDWQFIPGMKFGSPVAVPCTLDLVWGEANLSPQALEWAVTEISTPSISAIPAVPEPTRSAESSPVVAYKADPSYTEEARKAGLEGTVAISLFIGEDGVPEDLRVTRRLGLGLDEKAIDAVRQWRFRPALRNGLPFRVPATIEVNFRLPR